MANSHKYHRPLDPDSTSDDDLNLDELDPVTGSSNSSSRPGRSQNHTWTPGNSKGVPLRNLQGSKATRFWKTRRKGAQADSYDEDEAGLLGEWNGAPLRPRNYSDDEEGWNVKRSKRKRNVQANNESRTPEDTPGGRACAKASNCRIS